MKKLLAFLLILGISCSSCLAGSGPDEKHVEKIKRQVSKYLDRGARVSVETYDQHKLRGEINEAGPKSFVISVAGQQQTIQYTAVKKIKAPMDPDSKRRLIGGIVLGGLFGLIFGVAASDK